MCLKHDNSNRQRNILHEVQTRTMALVERESPFIVSNVTLKTSTNTFKARTQKNKRKTLLQSWRHYVSDTGNSRCSKARPCMRKRVLATPLLFLLFHECRSMYQLAQFSPGLRLCNRPLNSAGKPSGDSCCVLLQPTCHVAYHSRFITPLSLS